MRSTAFQSIKLLYINVRYIFLLLLKAKLIKFSQKISKTSKPTLTQKPVRSGSKPEAASNAATRKKFGKVTLK